FIQAAEKILEQHNVVELNRLSQVESPPVIERVGSIREHRRTAKLPRNFVPGLGKLRWQRRSRLVRHFPNIGMPAERKNPHCRSIFLRAPCGWDRRKQPALLVDESPDRPSTQQFRQLVPKMGERRHVWKFFKWVLWQKTLLRRDLVVGKGERREVR